MAKQYAVHPRLDNTYKITMDFIEEAKRVMGNTEDGEIDNMPDKFVPFESIGVITPKAPEPKQEADASPDSKDALIKQMAEAIRMILASDVPFPDAMPKALKAFRAYEAYKAKLLKETH